MTLQTIKKWTPLFVLSLALMVIVIDTTLLNVSLATIITDLKTNIQSMQWVISLYSLMLAAFTITGGRLGDLFGRKKMFIAGAILFATGSFIASISNGVGTLIWGESIIEGIGAALMMPATSSLLVGNYKGKDRALAFGVWGGVAAVALAIGPILGGYLTTYYSWRWGFRINIVVVAVLLLGSYFISESEDRKHKPTIDWFGIVLSSASMFSFVFGIIEASQYGWWKAKEVFAVGATQFPLMWDMSISIFAIIWGLILLICFIAWEIRVENRGKMPLVSFHLFENRQFVAGATTTGIISLGQTGTIFSVTLYLQAVRGLDAVHTGLSLLSMAIALFITSPLAGFLARYVSPKILIMTGLALNFLSVLWLYTEISVDATVLSLAPALALYGAGMGLVISQINNLTLSAVPVEEAGEASGVNGTFRQVGSTLGSAIVGAVLLSVLTSALLTNIQLSTDIPSELKTPIATSISEAHSNIEFGGIQAISSQIPDPTVGIELKKLSDDAMTKATRNAIFASSFIILLGFVSAFFLPKEKRSMTPPKVQPSAAH